jgi:hypothetical protein
MGVRAESVIGARNGFEECGWPLPPVFFVRVANKGVKLDAASRLTDAGFRVAVFSVSCGGAARVAGKRLGKGSFEGWKV